MSFRAQSPSHLIEIYGYRQTAKEKFSEQMSSAEHCVAMEMCTWSIDAPDFRKRNSYYNKWHPPPREGSFWKRSSTFSHATHPPLPHKCFESGRSPHGGNFDVSPNYSWMLFLSSETKELVHAL